RGPLAAYNGALRLTTPLAEGNEPDSRRDLAVCLSKVADALAFLGQRDEALANYRRSITILEQLTAADASKVLWQSDLAFTQTRIGMLLTAAGMRDAALEAYSKAAAVRDALAHKDPHPTHRH